MNEFGTGNGITFSVELQLSHKAVVGFSCGQISKQAFLKREIESYSSLIKL